MEAGDSMQFLTGIFVGCALYGTWLNLKKEKEGFIWWAVSDTGLLAINWLVGQYALALLFLVYLMLALEGLRKWK